MYQINPLIFDLRDVLNDVLKGYPHKGKTTLIQYLNGQTSIELRKLVPLAELRKSGAFFTGTKLAKLTISKDFISTINKTSVIADPTCGGGDLLLACTPFLPFSNKLSETLDNWQNQIIGVDIHPEFLEIAKIRLALKAIHLGSNPDLNSFSSINEYFNKFRNGSIFNNLDILQNASHVLLNPPFFLMHTGDLCNWGSGKVNAAAVFLETCINNVENGTRIAAILPDVLRSGTRYGKWRKFIESNCEIRRINLYGQFDKLTDVDVFVIELVVNRYQKKTSYPWIKSNLKTELTLADLFEISIGPVVDYRDPNDGPEYKYIYPRILPAWNIVKTISTTRQFKGRTFQPPFVVVRRTSRQSDKYRAIGTIINTNYEVAVENHLIILKPKDGSLSTCKKLLTKLHDERTNIWLNEQIRCRHLTIKSLSNLPWWRN